MKKTIFTIMLMAVATLLSAQSLQIENGETVFENDETVICPYNETFFEYYMDLHIRNNSDQDKNVVVEQNVVDTYQDVIISFCWGLCIVTDVNPFVSREVPIPANTLSSEEFAIHISIPDAETGIVKIIYNVYDVNNPDEKVSFTVLAGRNANVGEHNISLGQAYPNPASTQVHFDYANNNGSVANVVIYNLLGQEVKSQLISGSHGRINIAVDDLQPGIYFCNLLIDNTAVKTEKFIVKR